MKKIVQSVLLLLLLSSGALIADAQMEVEPNDGRSSANFLDFNGNTLSFEGFLTSWNSDYFSFELTKDSRITVESFNNLSNEYNFRLTDVNGNTLIAPNTSLTNSSNYEDFFSYGLPKGTYFIEIDRQSGNIPTREYNFKITKEESPYFEKESNNSRTVANLITTNTLYTGWFQNYDNDFYIFELSEDGELSIDVSNNLKVQHQLTLTDVNGRVLHNWNTSLNQPSMIKSIHTGLAKGTYYLNIQPYIGYDDHPQYDFKVNFKGNNFFEKETNDSRTTATPLTINKSMKGILEDSYDKDYFSFTVLQSKKYVFKASSDLNSKFELELYNNNGSSLKSAYTNFENKDESTLFSYTLEPGTYFVRMNKYNGSTLNVPYQISVAEYVAPVVDIPADLGSKFADYKPGQYWSEHMLWSIHKGVIQGYNNIKNPSTGRLENLIRPQTLLTEAQFLAILYRYLENDRVSKTVSTNPKYWANVYYQLAAQDGLPTSAKIGDLSKANQPITRGKMAQIFTSKHSGKYESMYDGVQFMYEAGLTDGYKDAYGNTPKTYNSFGVDYDLQRAHIVTFIKRYDDYVNQ